MKLSVDVMGFEGKLSEAIKACEHFIKKNEDVKIILFGNQIKINKLLKTNSNLEVVDCKDELLQGDTIRILHTKKDSSMERAIVSVLNNHSDGVLSAGSSPIYVYLTYHHFGLIQGIKKVAFVPYIPSVKGIGFNIADVGASIDCDATDLLHFAIMVNILAKLRGVSNPRIGILNIGSELHKGTSLQKEAHKIISKNKDLNYIGFIEPKFLLNNIVDVLVTDGFTGNLVLKTLEGTSKNIFKYILSFYKKPQYFFSFLFNIPVLIQVYKKFDYKNNAGAFLLGLNKIAIKTHSSADYKQFYSSLRMLKETISQNLLLKIKEGLKNEIR